MAFGVMVAGMDGHIAWRDGVEGTWKADRARMTGVIIASLLAALIGVGALLVWRRAVGASDGSLPALMLLEAWLIVGATVLGGRLVRFGEALSRKRQDGERQDEVVEAIVTWGGTLAIALWAIGCSFGDGWGAWVMWVALIAVDQAELWWLLRRNRKVKRIGMAQSIGGAGTATTGRGFLQEVVRERRADGVEVVRARVRAEFVAGQRQAVLHVGFCPPLEGVPVVTAEVVQNGRGGGGVWFVGVI
jgi:hypothetical protein